MSNVHVLPALLVINNSIYKRQWGTLSDDRYLYLWRKNSIRLSLSLSLEKKNSKRLSLSLSLIKKIQTFRQSESLRQVP